MKLVAVFCLLAWTTTALKDPFRGLRRMARKLQQRRRAEATSEECVKLIAEEIANNAKCYSMIQDGLCMNEESLTKLCKDNCSESLGDFYLKGQKAGCIDEDSDDGSCDSDEAKTACGDCEMICSSDSACTCDKVCKDNTDGVGICVDEDDDPTVCYDSPSDSNDPMSDQKNIAGMMLSNVVCSKNSSGEFCMVEFNDAPTLTSCAGFDSLGCCVGTIFGTMKEMDAMSASFKEAMDMLKEKCSSVDFDEVCPGVDLSQIKNPSSAYRTGTLVAFVVAAFAAIF